MIIEIPKIEDLKEIDKIAIQVHDCHVKWRPDIFEHTDYIFTKEELEEHIKNKEIYVAKIEEKIVGYILISSREGKQNGYRYRKQLCIDAMGVDENIRNQGIGRKLLTYIKELAQKDGYTDLRLTVNEENENAIHLYESFGFRVRNIAYTYDLRKDKEKYVCKIPTMEELIKKQDYEMEHANTTKESWKIWKKEAIERFENNQIIPYYGFIDGKTICEATAAIDPNIVQNSDDLIDDKTAYLYAFRTNTEYQGQGYFSILFKYMIEDLKKRGYTRATIGVEPKELRNKEIYFKYGFTTHIKDSIEKYPTGKEIKVEYYSKEL